MAAGDAVAPAGLTGLVLLTVLLLLVLLLAVLVLLLTPLGQGVGEVGVEPLVLLQEVVGEDGRVAVGDQAVVQLGRLVVQQNAVVGGGKGCRLCFEAGVEG